MNVILIDRHGFVGLMAVQQKSHRDIHLPRLVDGSSILRDPDGQRPEGNWRVQHATFRYQGTTHNGLAVFEEQI